jgi:threonylcarbamoyladenosine tRNA methylthiotransferase MtaB
VPYARSRIASLSPVDIHQQALLFAEHNYKEIVLTGINLSCYGDNNSYSLPDAIAAADVDGITRIRLSSLEPDLMDEKMIETLSKYKKLAPHFHLSLQSGSDRVLSDMNRNYTTVQYRNIVENMRDAFISPTFTTDIMVGFPTETEYDFDESLNFVSSLGFLKCHVFSYSPRPGTPAADLKQLPDITKKSRVKQMIEATDSVRQSILTEQIGKTVSIIVEQRNKTGWYEGYTEHYLPVVTKDIVSAGDIVQLNITSVEKDRCIGRCV